MEPTTVEQEAPAGPVGRRQAWLQLLEALRGRGGSGRRAAVQKAWQQIQIGRAHV